MSQSLRAYLPQDRLHALANGKTLLEHASGTALFADISGFTSLTEALTLVLGSRRGAEALSQQINQIYTVLVVEVERWHGSVIGFAGDALTCWFDNTDGLSAPRAAACALALQGAIATVNQITLPDSTSLTLGLKVALATGPARRFVVGDPDQQQFDVLAGQTLTRVAAVEHCTTPGEVLLDQATTKALGDAATLAGWRDDPEHDARYAILAGLGTVPATPWPTLPPDSPRAEQLRPWLLPAIFQRYQDGLGDFLTELRPLVGMFIRFVGIDYDHDPDASAELDALTQVVQLVLARYEGTLLQITIGDKGSSFYAAFGAPIAHEDDLQRAVQAALEIQLGTQALGSVEPLQIGLSQGTLIVGAYGAASRLTYAALGDEINLAARLMMLAAPGETLLSGRSQRTLITTFVLEPRPPIRVKGKAEPLPVTAILARRRRRSIRLEEPAYVLPMVGRRNEVGQIIRVLDMVSGGAGQILAITGEAGLGKSRLVAETIRLSRQRGFLGYGGACQATSTTTPYLVWEAIWRAFFNLDPEAPPRKQTRVLEGALEDLAPDRIAVLPLLGPLLNITLPDNDFTRGLQPKERQSALHALLRACLISAAHEAQNEGGGLLLVLEDLHWSDETSLQLLREVAETLVELPVLVVLAYRPLEQKHPALTQITTLPFFSVLALSGLESSSSEDLIRAKLAQLFPARNGSLLPTLVRLLTERSQGNPFYLEELLNYLHDRAIDPYDTGAVEALELPESLSSLVLSRLDQLSNQQQALLKMASVIGRRFLVAWLNGAFADLRSNPELQEDLVALTRNDLTAVDADEPEIAYLFKHMITQQVAYESLNPHTRAMLHERLAAYLEALAGDTQETYLELLAYHYDRSINREKQRHFHWLAGLSASRRYANESAINHFNRVLELTSEEALTDRFDTLLARANVYHTIADRHQQYTDIQTLTHIAERLNDHHRRATLFQRQIAYAVFTSDYPTTLQTAQYAIHFIQTHQLVIRPMIYGAWSFALSITGNQEEALAVAEEGLRQAQVIGDQWHEAELTGLIGFHLYRMGHYTRARAQLLQSITTCHTIGHTSREGFNLLLLCMNLPLDGHITDSQEYIEQELTLARLLGDRHLEGGGHTALGITRCYMGIFDQGRDALNRALELALLTKSLLGEAYTLCGLGFYACCIGAYERALHSYQDALARASKINDPVYQSTALAGLGYVHHCIGDHQRALSFCEDALALTIPKRMYHEQAGAYTFQGQVYLALGRLDDAEQAYHKALTLRQTLQQHHLVSEAHIGLARVAQLYSTQGKREHAPERVMGHIEMVVTHITSWNLVGTFDPLDICNTCYELLSLGTDERANTVLQIAYTELQRRAGSISDERSRTQYLALPAHARITEAWKTSMHSHR